jgi:DNA-binding NtrC family response regulator
MTRTETLSADFEPVDKTPLRTFLFVALEATNPLRGSARHLLDEVDEVLLGRGEAQVERERGRLMLRFPDPRMSTEHARLKRSKSEWHLYDAGSKNGSFVRGERIDGAGVVQDGDWIELGTTFFRFRRLRAVSNDSDVRHGERSAAGSGTVLPELEHRLGLLASAARSDLSVLIRGETGTGKELAARAVHHRSARKGSFVAVNCGALAPSLIDSELFGHKKGAFSGATDDRPGLLRASDGGTLFLDEVGELALPAQAALLRALQEREVRPVGAVRPIEVDLRVVCATHRDLEAMAAQEQFRSDLLARLTGFTLRLPPLRERREDIGALIASTLSERTASSEVRFTTSAARKLLAAPWLTNIRGLAKCVAAGTLFADGKPIDASHLELVEGAAPVPNTTAGKTTAALSDEDRRVREQLVMLLEKHGGNISAVAREMGKARFQVRRWIKRFHLDVQ